MSISSVITLGYGQGVKFLPTIGYLSGSAPNPAPDVVLLGGKAYLTPYSKHKEEQYQRDLKAKQETLRLLNEEIALAEREALAERQREAARKNAALEMSLQQEINALRMERERLIRLIDEEETILVLLLSLSFH